MAQITQITHWWSDLMDLLFFRYDFAAELSEGDSLER
ncbi:hypothetical protein BH09PSE6_BH09PSE6_22190 [soil metagenome]